MINTGVVQLVAAVLPAVLAMALIYIVTANIQKIAAFVDKLLRPDKKPENDGLYDIYEGRMPGEKTDNEDKREEKRS
ncbi:MAG: hypothetical protein J6F31_06535 [Oscillospiraceae bacterium]|nr:hypothetical protein [Oscillospiraceae bacterium]